MQKWMMKWKVGEVEMIQIDMQMPEACDVCPFNYDFCWCTAFGDDDNWDKYSDDWNKNVCERTNRPEYCPLKEQEAVEAEYEGDARSTWWWVCGECHTPIEDKDKFCKECGRRILWGK